MFYVALEIAGDLEQGGALFVRGIGPMTVAEIAKEVDVTEAQTKKGLDAMVSIGFMSLRDDGAFVIEKWSEKTDPEDVTAAARQKRKRERDKSVTSRVTETDVSRRDSHYNREEEVEIDTTPDGVVTRSVPKPCLCVGTALVAIPDTATPEDLADQYLEMFVNARSVSAKAKRRAGTVGMLREMHEAGHSWSTIFDACATVHADGNHAPIFQATPIWTALRAKSKPSERNEYGESVLAGLKASGRI